jgi:hypothetical protein
MRAPVIAALAAAGLWAHAAFSQPPRPWPPGEELRYRISFGLLDAGEATLRAEGPVNHGGRTCWRLSAEVVTGPVVSSLYKVRDRLESLADTTDLRCWRSRVSIQEGGYHERIETDFDQEAGFATDQRGRQVAVPAGCHDVLAAWFHARTLALAVDDTVALPVLAGHKVGWLRIVVDGRETVETTVGRRACLLTTASLGGLAPARLGREIRIWVTDDDRRLPVRIEIAAPVGNFVATLLPESETPTCAGSPWRP